MLQPGKVLQGRYRIERLLGRGGMGAVYLARHLTLGSKSFAIKEMVAAVDPDADLSAATEQFRREGELLASLEHPGIVRVTDCFEEGARLYLVMEFIEGETLQAVLEAGGPMDPATVCRRLLEICDILGYLHGHDPIVLVRDLKPGNVMIDGAGKLRLIDFGIARAAGAGGRAGASARGAGTPGFSPVEQFTGTTDARCDIYAMGATAYAMLTRRVPPHALDLVAGNATLTAVSEINRAVPASLEAVVSRMMALGRHARYATVAEVRAALASIVDAMPSTVDADSPTASPLAPGTLGATTEASRGARALRKANADANANASANVDTDTDQNVLGQATVMPDDVGLRPQPVGPKPCLNCKGTGRSRVVRSSPFGGRRIVGVPCPDCLGFGTKVDEHDRRRLESAAGSGPVWAGLVMVATAASLIYFVDLGPVPSVAIGAVLAAVAWGATRTYAHRLREALEAQVKEARSKAETANRALAAALPPGPSRASEAAVPSRINRFFGRQHELESLRHLLCEAETRFITVLGLGGIGKTRFVTETCQRFRDSLPPIMTLSLAGAVERDEILRRMCEGLQVRLSAGVDPLPRLKRALFPMDLLLILDGAEGLRRQDLLVELVREAPNLQVVCTSRQRLQLEGEQIFELEGLDVPASDARPADVRASSAVMLFTARASNVRRDFVLDDRTAPLVGEICRELHGHPFSIEIAASRLRTFSLEDVVSRLKDRFATLLSERDEGDARQRSLHGIIDWSYQLLQPDEQRLLMQLSMFGGFWLEAVERVLGGQGRDLADRLATLQDNSLLSSAVVGARRRWFLLPTVQAFAEGLLASTSSAEVQAELRRGHAGYYCERLERSIEVAHGAEEQVLTDELTADLDNFRTALRWATQADHALAARLAIGGAHLLLRIGLWEEARDWAARAVEQAAAGADSSLRARASLAQADVLHSVDDLEAALTAAEGARLAAADDAQLAARADNLEGVILHALKRYDEARAHFQGSLAVREKSGEAKAIAVVRHNLALLDQSEGRLDDALREYNEVLRVRSELSDLRGSAETLNNIGEVLKSLNRPDEARPAFARALAAYERAGDRVGLGITRFNMGEMFLQQGRMEEAQSEVAGALRIFEELRLPYAAPARDLLRQTVEEPVPTVT